MESDMSGAGLEETNGKGKKNKTNTYLWQAKGGAVITHNSQRVSDLINLINRKHGLVSESYHSIDNNWDWK